MGLLRTSGAGPLPLPKARPLPLALQTYLLSPPWRSTCLQVRSWGVGSLRGRGPDSNPGTASNGASPALAPTHPISLLSAALKSTSKKPQGAGQVGDPKHAPAKIQGADNLKVSHFILRRVFLTPGPR